MGMRKTLAEGKVKRGDLFVRFLPRRHFTQPPIRLTGFHQIQTKFTSVNGQDSTNLPYDPKAPIAVQVHASIASSLHNLRTSDDPAQAESTYFDSLILHSPLPTLAATLEAWRACESHVPASIKHLGISNAPLPVLHALCDAARVKPAVVQNRFHRDTGYEGELRRFCRERGIVFQGFWTLTANPFLLKAGPVVALAKTATVEREVALYALVMGLRGVVVCNGTRTHMQEDLEGLASVREWAGAEAYEWENLVKKFKELVNDQDKKMAMARDDVV